MTVGGNCGSVRNVIPDAGNDGVDVRDIVTNGWSCRTGVYCNFLLGAGGQQRSSSGGVHVKNLQNLVQVQPPGGDRVALFFFAWKWRETTFRLSHLTRASSESLPRSYDRKRCRVWLEMLLAGSIYVNNLSIASHMD